MTPKNKPKVALSKTAWDDLKQIPGNARRRMIAAIDELEVDPRPPRSKALEGISTQHEIRRLRLDPWRIVYLIIEEQPLVLAVRRRPPYDYADVAALIEAEE
jgi:mRNA-degrading endonuclease RelE of RelBE toxin-antitoxin system